MARGVTRLSSPAPREAGGNAALETEACTRSLASHLKAQSRFNGRKQRQPLRKGPRLGDRGEEVRERCQRRSREIREGNLTFMEVQTGLVSDFAEILRRMWAGSGLPVVWVMGAFPRPFSEESFWVLAFDVLQTASLVPQHEWLSFITSCLVVVNVGVDSRDRLILVTSLPQAFPQRCHSNASLK